MMDTEQNIKQYAMIFGQGRSGTNWLLNLLDLASNTYCRNEPDEMPGSPFSALPSPWVAQPQSDTFGSQWDHAVATESHRMSYRDHRLKVSKDYLGPISRGLKFDYILKGKRFRSVLSLVQPALHNEVFDLPRWYASQKRLQDATPVLKLNNVPAWAVWMLEHRTNAHALHIVRHPGGFLNSYRNRWLKHEDRQRVQSDNHRRLRMIADTDSTWADHFGDIDATGIEESELWFWRYACETIDAAGQQHTDRYQRIIYENMVANPLDTAQQAYATCGLQWTGKIARHVKATTHNSNKIATAWRDRLDKDLVALIDRVLDTSPMKAWWNE